MGEFQQPAGAGGHRSREWAPRSGGAAGTPGLPGSVVVKGRDHRVLAASQSPPICLIKLVKTF